MLIQQPQQVDPLDMDIPGAIGVSLRVLIGRDNGAANFAMRHFTVEPGGHTPEHRHNYEHEVLILAGKGIVRGGETWREFEEGDVLFIPPNELHQFKNTGDQPMQFICLVPVQFNCADGTCQPTPGC